MRHVKIAALAASLALLGAPHIAAAQGTPVTIVVPFTPGTTPDFLSRMIGEELQARTGRPFVTENKPGASGNLGTFQVARAAPDGSTLLMTTASHASTNVPQFRKFAFDPETSFAPIALIATSALALVVSPSTPANNVQEYVSFARTQSGRLNYASPGPMSTQHLVMEMFKARTKTEAVHVPYPGSAGAVRDVVAGHVNAMFMPIETALPLAAENKVRILAVASRTRSPLAPQVPTLDESGVSGIDVALWFGLLAPAGTPEPVVARYNALVNDAIKMPKIHDAVAKQGQVLVGGTPEKFRDWIADEMQRWTKLVAEVGIKPEAN
jgi:tripartite-type tricarboxylate transporter receptor subunit TctC